MISISLQANDLDKGLVASCSYVEPSELCAKAISQVSIVHQSHKII